MKKNVSVLFAVILLISCFPVAGIAIDTRVEAATQAAIAIANDDSHGYSQNRRQGNPDYDCSSLVCSVFYDAGFTSISRWGYTGSMESDFVNAGFNKITGIDFSTDAALQRGDVLWKRNSSGGHTEIYIGNGQMVGAHWDHNHPEGGDQGGEISVVNYSNSSGWMAVFRYGDRDPIPKPLSNGGYRLRNNSNGLYLVVNNGDYSQGRNNVSTYQLTENANEQIWTLTDDSIGYRITPRGNELCLNAYGEYAKNGDDVGLWQNTAPNHSTQRWNLEAVNGGYVVRNAYNASSVLTVVGGNDVKLGTYTGASSQIWTIEPYTPPAEQYYLDINLTVDGTANNGGLESVTFDVYINGSKVAEDVSDYYAQHPKGKNYTVNDIRVNGCYTNKGSTTFFGTINANTTVTIQIATYHKSETIPAVAVTCTDIGYTEGTKCATCGMIISKPQPINPVGHQWDEGVVTKEPTATEAGERTYTCTVCGKMQADPTPPLPYLPGDINGDCAVNNKDLTRLMKYLAGEDVTVIQAALDVNGDRAVNNKDLTRLMKYLAGEIVNVI